ncbi:MAG: hypothetical protein RSF67_10325 [Clostridia bacterium]
MSKLYNIYLSLKKEEPNTTTLYLFKSGIFFIFIDNDAQSIYQLLNLKLTHLTNTIVKCGFPISSLEKYLNLLESTPYTIKIIDTTSNTIYAPKDFSINTKITELLNIISKIDIDNLSVKQAYESISNIKNSVNLIKKEELK